MLRNSMKKAAPQVLDLSNAKLYNEIYIPLFYTDKRRRVLYGGRDSGKSDFIAQWYIINALQPKFFRGLLVRKYYASIRSSQFQTILDYLTLWGIRDLFKVNENPLKITCASTNNMILASGLDKPDQTLGVKDPTCAWYEEADQISRDAYLYTSNSLRSSMTDKIVEWFSFNPRNERSWLNEYFFPAKQTYEKEGGDFDYINSVRDDSIILHTYYKNNMYCPITRRRELEDLINYDYNYYKVNTLGLWGGSLKGLIYPNYNIINEFPEGIDYVFGLDYGYNSPSALVKVGYSDKNLYLEQCLYSPSYTHTNLGNFIVNHYENELKKSLVVVDSAEPALIQVLRSRGINAIPAVKNSQTIKTVYDGIMYCKQFGLNVVAGSDDLIKEFDGYSWKSDKDGHIFDEPVKIDDHAMDAFRYVVQTYGIRNWKTTPHSVSLNTKSHTKSNKKFIGF